MPLAFKAEKTKQKQTTQHDQVRFDPLAMSIFYSYLPSLDRVVPAFSILSGRFGPLGLPACSTGLPPKLFTGVLLTAFNYRCTPLPTAWDAYHGRQSGAALLRLCSNYQESQRHVLHRPASGSADALSTSASSQACRNLRAGTRMQPAPLPPFVSWDWVVKNLTSLAWCIPWGPWKA